MRCQARFRWLVVVLVSGFLLVCSLAEAQRITGSVFGVVRDESGGVMPGATVEVKTTAAPTAMSDGDPAASPTKASGGGR